MKFQPSLVQKQMIDDEKVEDNKNQLWQQKADRRANVEKRTTICDSD